MEYFAALQTAAMLAVVKPDREAWLRYVMREYSKNFHTALHVVQSLPLEEVLRNYYENVFEAMSEEDRAEHIERLSETPEERAKREREEEEAEISDDAAFEALNRQVAEDMQKKKGKAPKSMEKAVAAQKVVEESLIDMKFGNDGNLDLQSMLDQDPLGATQSRK